MKVKGTAALTIPEFVRKNYSSRFDDWLNSLPENSKPIMSKPILPGSWLEVRDAVSGPLQQICSLFYAGSGKGAWEAGRFSADHALKGIYKTFVKLGTPNFIIARAASIIRMYYTDINVEIKDSGKGYCVMHMQKYPEPNQLLEMRIGGWIERALEISGCKSVSVNITQSITKGHPITEYSMKWN